jgi:hypothetical protein
MRFAYADPPYLGQGMRLYGDHPLAGKWDTLTGHAELIELLVREYPDGWAMSLSSPSLRLILPLCPEDVRVMAWVKPFAVFKPNVNPAYAWEPVIVRGGRKRDREALTVRDWVSTNITLMKGLPGAKPAEFCRWILDVLGYEEGDVFDDLFPGTGIMDRVRSEMRFAL